ncbi:probable alternative oxidase, mitochondrial [Coccomyxa sp. Obi]|nr:probable alternative oxidase, mitochondrial [Coccomyxa sp. Obi]
MVQSCNFEAISGKTWDGRSVKSVETLGSGSGVLMSRRVLANALRPVQRHMGSALDQAMLRLHGRGLSGGVDEETFQRLIREQEEAYAEAMEQERKRQGMPLPYPSLRLEEYTYIPAKLPHYPDAYLESKHTQPFAHWRSPKGMAEWTGFLAAQAFNAAAAAVAHVPSWLIRIPRDTVWFRRLLLLECVMPVPGAIASMAGHMRALATLRGPGSFVRSYGRESENAREHLLTLLQLRPSLALRALVLASQAVFAVPYMTAYLISPRACHAFVCHLSGLTGEATSDALRDLDAGTVPAWQRAPAPASAAAYWGLPEGATMRMVLLVMRADMIARSAINQAANIATFKPGCQLATVEDILNEEYPLDYNLPDGPVILRSQSNASSLSDAGSSLSGSRKDLASPTAAPTLRRTHSAARAAFQDATPAKFGVRASSAPKTDPDMKPPRNMPAASRRLHKTAGAPALATIDLTEEKDVQLHAVEDDKNEKPPHKKGARAELNTEGKQPDLAAIMDSMWGSSRF